ncbi:hypothetical protein G4B88_019430 [Cannabis sativa]|uniref:SWIM-type domain-containing protein n=1 Tax=Cannabis sativa TaxID=3483 RepID=A0A7J6HZI8_CANSA|nr:hypothetical protein G4B88_019430 [Cannabis sativa]
MGRKKQYAGRKKGWPIPKDDENEIPFYETTSTFFTLKVHHKGTIDYTLNVPTSYNGGVVEYVHWLDLKYMSMFELELIARDLDFVLTEKIAATLKDYDHEIECFFSHPQLNENVAYESEATFPTVVELGDVGKDAGPNLDDENVTPIKEGIFSIMWHKVRMIGLTWLMRLKNEDESEEGSEDDYEEDPECRDEDMVESDSEQVARDDSSEEDEGDENNGIQLNKRKKRFKKEKLPKLPEFRPETDMGKAIFDLGLSFASGKLFKQAIREYALREGKDIFFKKNDPHRVRAQCKGVNCRWMCYAFKIDDSPTFVIKSYEAEHKCCRTNSNRWATAQWLSAKYREEFKNKEEAGSHLPTKSGELIYQIHNMYGNIYSVDLRSWVCSCRRWELTGIPCSHVVAVIWHNKQDPELYVSKWYTKEYYMKAYSHQIFPIRIQDEWPRSGKIGMINPIHKKQPGRPKKSRKLELQELVSGKKLKKKFVIIKCSVCGGKGHNLRTCGSNKTTSITIYGLENTERVSTISFLIELFLTKYSIVAYSGKINLMPVNDSSKALHVQDMNVVVQAGEDPKQWRREFVAGGKLGSRLVDGGAAASGRSGDHRRFHSDGGWGWLGSRGWVWVRVGGFV